MAEDRKTDWRLRIAVAAAVCIVILLVVEGGLPFLLLILYVVFAAFLLYILWRGMRALERFAEATEKLASNNEKKP